jgi:hypothetical protein
MRFASDQSEQILQLRTKLHRASLITPSLMVEVLALAEARRPWAGDRAERIRRFIRAAAWTNGALALVELGLPTWKLRRIVHEDGEWHCCLGKQRPLPEWLDDVVEAGHPVLPLAILTALVEACAVTSFSTEVAPTVPSIPASA